MMFTEPLAAKIIKGEKTATRRVMSDKLGSPWFTGGCKYEVGQAFAVNPGRRVLRVVDATVTAIYEQRPEQIRTDQAKAEGFGSATAFFDAFTTINRGINLSRPVWVVEFDLTGPNCLECGGSGWWCDWNGEEGGAGECRACYGTGIAPSDRAKALIEKVEEDERQASA